ncbi:hypothetical protein POTOM_006759 [Populus tomentosa]|uniref:FHA domain-containing protein n=1 Tax=Populus tomentosa TaxID=118781 RepID=A0A8X8APG5_POPTO|nr:hypothetical protein POTOM_006759 [Populus tomentosa]
MGRNLSQSPHRDRHRSSHRDRDASPVREKQQQQQQQQRSSRSNNNNKSPKKREMSPPLSPPARHRSSQKDRSPVEKERNSNRGRSPSPRTKRLRRSQDEKEGAKMRDREVDRNHDKKGSEKGGTRREREGEGEDYERSLGKGGDKGLQREGEAERNRRERGEREVGKERRSGRDEIEGKSSSRGRHRGRSTSPLESDRRNRIKHGSRSPLPQTERDRIEGTNSRGAEQRNSDDDNYDDSVAKMKAAEEALEVKKKQEPSFELSGKLAAETNRVRGVTLLFTEPPDAKKPNVRWRLYVFKGGEALNVLVQDGISDYGRNLLTHPLADVYVSNNCIGKQNPFIYIVRAVTFLGEKGGWQIFLQTIHHAASNMLLFNSGRSKISSFFFFAVSGHFYDFMFLVVRQVEKEQPDGMLKKQVRPYVMDLGSTNKTFINDNPIEPQRYYELFEKDTIKFGNSRRPCSGAYFASSGDRRGLVSNVRTQLV